MVSPGGTSTVLVASAHFRSLWQVGIDVLSFCLHSTLQTPTLCSQLFTFNVLLRWNFKFYSQLSAKQQPPAWQRSRPYLCSSRVHRGSWFHSSTAGTSAWFWLQGLMPPCHLRRRNFDYEMVHSEVYLNKYVVSIAPFSTPACHDCSQNIP